jgi:hypothetical protein
MRSGKKLVRGLLRMIAILILGVEGLHYSDFFDTERTKLLQSYYVTWRRGRGYV